MLFRRFGLFVTVVALLGMTITALIQPSGSNTSGFTVEQRLELWKAQHLPLKSSNR